MASLMQCTFFLFMALASGYCATYVPGYGWGAEGGWLKYHYTPATWEDARTRCQAEGAILASPHTEQQMADMVSLAFEMDLGNEKKIFTGVHATFSKGDYSSIEGVPLLRLPIFWAPGEPNNRDNSERCLAMMKNGFFADTRCDERLPYICYKKDTKVTKAKEYRFDYEWSELAGGWLKYHAVPATWGEAAKRCRAEGALLVAPFTDPLKEAVGKFVLKQKVTNRNTIFTGFNRLNVGQEPTDACSSMTVNGTRYSFDATCRNVLPYVCYKEYTVLTITECGTADPEYELSIQTGSCYKFHNRGLVWSEAYMTCVAEGGYLAIINDDVEAEVIRKILTKTPIRSIYSYYGYHRLTAVGVYSWSNRGFTFSTIHGEPLESNYHIWHAGEPNNHIWHAGEPNNYPNQPSTAGEYCGTIGNDLELYDYKCDVPIAFICEKMPKSLLKNML